MDKQHRLVGHIIQAAYDFLNKDMNEALLSCRIRRRRVPNRREIVGKLEKPGAIDFRACRYCHAKVFQPPFEFIDAFQRTVPTRLQLSCDVALRGIYELVSTRCERGLILGRFKISLNRGGDLFRRPLDLICGKYRGFDGSVGDGFHDLNGDSFVDAYATDTNA